MASASSEAADGPAKLDRRSAVPLYHQLQETLKQQIESGQWPSGHALPSEPELARQFGVSRVVVRMALSVLEDDHQIIRIQGRGTFVAKPKLNYRAGGLSRMLDLIEDDADLEISVIDRNVLEPEEAVRRRLGAVPEEPILRLTTSFISRGTTLALGYSYFRRAEVQWLERLAVPGTKLPHTPDVFPREHGVELAHSDLTIESATSGAFDAEHFELPVRSPQFLVSVVEHRQTAGGATPFEVARIGYRADILQVRLEVSPQSSSAIQATWALVDSGWPPEESRP
jgi:GntR family transcriptional regulator, N-acetylglucosamine utilization regulator